MIDYICKKGYAETDTDSINSPNLQATMLNDIPGIVHMETFESRESNIK